MASGVAEGLKDEALLSQKHAVNGDRNMFNRIESQVPGRSKFRNSRTDRPDMAVHPLCTMITVAILAQGKHQD